MLSGLFPDAYLIIYTQFNCASGMGEIGLTATLCYVVRIIEKLRRETTYIIQYKPHQKPVSYINLLQSMLFYATGEKNTHFGVGGVGGDYTLCALFG